MGESSWKTSPGNYSGFSGFRGVGRGSKSTAVRLLVAWRMGWLLARRHFRFPVWATVDGMWLHCVEKPLRGLYCHGVQPVQMCDAKQEVSPQLIQHFGGGKHSVQ